MGTAFLLAVLAAAGLAAAPSPVVLDRIAAVVGDDVILESDLDRMAAVGVVERRPGEADAAYLERVLGERVVEVLRERELRKTAGFTPDASDVEARFRAVADRISKERSVPFETVLASAGVTRAEALEWVRHGLAIETYVTERLLPTVRVSPEEMESFYSGPFQIEAKARGLSEVPPFRDVEDQVRVLLRERKLNAEVERWTDELRQKTRVVVFRRARQEPAPKAASEPQGSRE